MTLPSIPNNSPKAWLCMGLLTVVFAFSEMKKTYDVYSQHLNAWSKRADHHTVQLRDKAPLIPQESLESAAAAKDRAFLLQCILYVLGCIIAWRAYEAMKQKDLSLKDRVPAQPVPVDTFLPPPPTQNCTPPVSKADNEAVVPGI